MADAGRTSPGGFPYRALLLLIVVMGGALLLFPRIFGPRVEIVPSPYPGDPFSLSLSIANQNLTPFTDIDYSCSVENVEPVTGSLAHDPKAVHQGRRLRLPGRTPMLARCDTAYMIPEPLKSAEYDLTIHYHAFPWRQLLTARHIFAAQLDKDGHVTGWVAK